MAVGLLMVRRRSFLLIEPPLRPVSGVDDVDEVNAARPSVLYAVAGPSALAFVAPFELSYGGYGGRPEFDLHFEWALL